MLNMSFTSSYLPSGYDIHSLPWYRWPIEIDGLPIKNGGFSMAMLNNQFVYFNALFYFL
jgi:hypothetical protein